MTKKRWLLAFGVVAVAAAVAVGLSLALTGGGKKAPPPAKTSLAVLFQQAVIGDKKAAVLARWPPIPYQHYSDNLKDDCYEWQGDYLYNLCFKDGVLRSKEMF